MRIKRELPELAGYMSVSEAAQRLGVSKRRVYDFLDEGRLEGVKSGNMIMIAEESVERFKPQISGRRRTVTPLWRMSSDENTRHILSIVVQLRAGQQGKFMERLQRLKQEKVHLFPGTGDRYIAEDDASPGMIEIQLRWKQGDMLDEVAREEALEAFRELFADVLDWQTAQYQMKTVLLHT
ncbi:MAG: helix-turn-helix domain-containing protein [Ktedonobacteraceae bacterium]